MVDQIADALDGHVRRRCYGSGFGGGGVVPLAHEHRRQLILQYCFHGRQQVRLVVDHDIVFGWIALLHMVEYALLVQVDHNPAFDRIPYSRALNFTRLEDDVAVRQNHG